MTEVADELSASHRGGDPEAGGDEIARAVGEHTLSDDERRALAAAAAFLTASVVTGELSDSFVESDLAARVARLSLSYPSIFERCDESGLAPDVAPLVAARSDFRCGNDCAPSSAALQKTFSAATKELVQRLLTKVPAEKWLGFTAKMTQAERAVAAKSAAASADAMAASLTPNEVSEILAALGEALAGIQALSAAAGLVPTPASPALLLVSEVAGALGTGVMLAEVALELRKASDLVEECRAWHKEHERECDPCGVVGRWTVTCPAQPGCGGCLPHGGIAFDLVVPSEALSRGGWSTELDTNTFDEATCSVLSSGGPCATIDRYVFEAGRASAVVPLNWCFDTQTAMCTVCDAAVGCTAMKVGSE